MVKFKINKLLIASFVCSFFYTLDMNVKETFGRNLREARKNRKLTQEQLAEQLSITPQHLGSIERGEAFVSADLLERMSAVLSMPVSVFFYSVDEVVGTETFLQKIDGIIERELLEVSKIIRKEIRK